VGERVRTLSLLTLEGQYAAPRRAPLQRIKGYRNLPQLRAALQAKIGKAERMEGTRIA